MLERLTLRNLGPAPEMDFALGERVNLITGDNGLGKSFVLDLAWWALTRSWSEGRVIRPSPGASEASVAYEVWGKTGKPDPVTRTYDVSAQEWSRLPQGRPPSPGLILYARIDGGFCVKDPERNYWKDTDSAGEPLPRSESFQFSKRELWDGLEDENGKVICRGLVEDWGSWRLQGLLSKGSKGAFSMLEEVLAKLSPEGREPSMRPGKPTRIEEAGAVDIPTLEMPYGPVPIYHASAGVKRILSLAYLIVWAWTEHQIEARHRGHESANRIVLLWDEIEAHLHPQWQRTILPSVVGVLEKLLREHSGIQLQVIATTHAPLVLASMETHWDRQKDRLFNLELEENGKQVCVEEVEWALFGDASGWLTSPAFDMESGYSREAERAIRAADDLMAGYVEDLPDDLRDAESINRELTRTLDGGDPYWPLWLPYYRQEVVRK